MQRCQLNTSRRRLSNLAKRVTTLETPGVAIDRSRQPAVRRKRRNLSGHARGVRIFVEQSIHRIQGEKLTVIDDCDLIAQSLYLFHVMRCVDDRSTLPMKSFNAVEYVVARLRIDTHGWLVQEQDFRIVHECRREIEPALHATGKRTDAIFPPILQLCELQRPLDAVPFLRAADPVERSEERQVLNRGEFVVKRQ